MIAADVDPIVMENRSSDRNVMIVNGRVPLKDGSVDMIVSDYVLEHIDDVAGFVAEVDRLLKPGGLFCARIPHKFNYVALAASFMPEWLEGWLLSLPQPSRKSKDVFLKVYRLNTLAEIRTAFPDHADSSFVYRSEPSYTFGSKVIYSMMDVCHRFLPVAISGNIFIFLRKPLVRPQS